MFIDVLNHPMLEKFDVSSLRTGQEVVILVRRCCCTVNASDLRLFILSVFDFTAWILYSQVLWPAHRVLLRL